MILVSPFNYPPFRTVKIRSQRITTCRACGDQDKMKEEDFKSKIQPDLKGEDYFTFCGLNRVAEDTRHLVQANVTVSSQSQYFLQHDAMALTSLDSNY